MAQLRRMKRMSQEALAALLGISSQQVSKYERGINKVSAERFELIMEMLQADLPAGFAEEAAPTYKGPPISEAQMSKTLSQTRDLMAQALEKLDVCVDAFERR